MSMRFTFNQVIFAGIIVDGLLSVMGFRKSGWISYEWVMLIFYLIEKVRLGLLILLNVAGQIQEENSTEQ